MIDVQSLPDDRELSIDKVGVKGIRYPITILDRKRGQQQTVASVNMYVNLPHQFKGTHMSRFIEVLNHHRGSINIRDISDLLVEVKRHLEAQSAHVELKFPYFIMKQAPVSGAEALMDYDVNYVGEIDENDKITITLGLRVPVTTVCPCSKEISDRGAHNQRGMVSLNLRFERFIWIEEIIRLVEGSGSGELFALLKREDEKHCTEVAFDNPRFVEDVVRDVAKKLQAHHDVLWFKVETENSESIHNHNAYACIEMKNR